jgi:hypothetical protein
VKAVVDNLAKDDPAFALVVAKALAPLGGAPEDGQFGRALCDALVEVSSHEGPDVYQLAWRLSAPSLRDASGHEYQSPGDDPDQWIAAQSPERDASLARFWEMEGRGLSRAATVLRAVRQLYRKASAHAVALRPALVERILRVVIPYHQAAAARRAKYVPSRHEAGVAWGYSLSLAGVAAIAALFIRRARR